MPFRDFLGNEPTVRHLRESIATGRLPNALILAGPRGAGKYTLAIMLAQAANCLNPQTTDGLPDFCGVCSNCERIGQSRDLDARVDEAIAAREELRDVDKRETRIFIQTHPDAVSYTHLDVYKRQVTTSMNNSSASPSGRPTSTSFAIRAGVADRRHTARIRS